MGADQKRERPGKPPAQTKRWPPARQSGPHNIGNAMVGLILESLVVASFAAWLVIASVSCFSAYKCQCDPPPIATDYNPATVLIIPVRGVPKHLDALWLGICTQIFRPFRVVFAVESVADRAHEALRSLSGGPATEIVVAGATVQRS